MKKVLLIFILMFGITSAFAQSSTAKAKNKGKQGQAKKAATPEERAEKVTSRLKTELGLTEEQVPKVKAITLTRAQKMSEIRGKAATATDKTALKAERKSAYQAWETDLKGILTPEQFTKFQAKKEEKKKKLQEKRKNAGKKTAEGEETVEELEEEVGE